MNRITTLTPARDSLMEDTERADAATLLDHLRDRCMDGNLEPITTSEALEAIHRRQPASGPMPEEERHALRIMARVRCMLCEVTIECDNRRAKQH